MRTIMLHDLRVLWRDGIAGIVLVVLCAVAGLGAWNGARWTARTGTVLSNAQNEQAARYGQIKRQIRAADNGHKFPPTQDPRLPSYVGSNAGQHYAALPPLPLAALSAGQSDLYPWYYRVSTRAWSALLNTDEIENPEHLLAGRFDLAFVLIYLYPLLVIALSYNLVSGEREAGTLAVTLSQPVELTRLLAGRSLVRLGLVLVPSSLVCVLAAWLTGGAASTGSLLLWLLALCLYGIFWFALAALVNGLGFSSPAAALTLFGCWLTLVIVVPNTIGIAASVLYPAPSRVELIQAMREATNAANRQSSMLLARYYDDHPELAPSGEANASTEFATRSLAAQGEVEHRVGPILESYDVQLDRQQAFAGSFRFLSPATTLYSAMNHLAGTSTERYRDFVSQVRGFHREWQNWFRPRIFRRENLTVDDVDDFPRFVYTPGNPVTVVSRVAVDVAALLAVTAAACAAARWSLRRYRVAA